jgi:hypothetical protein
VFKQGDFTLTPVGGARLRGFSPLLALDRVVSANVDVAQRLVGWDGPFGQLSLWAGPFADAGAAHASASSVAGLNSNLLVDAGVGLTVRGRFYDRDINLRIDAPLVVNNPIVPASLGGLPSGIRWTVQW